MGSLATNKNYNRPRFTTDQKFNIIRFYHHQPIQPFLLSSLTSSQNVLKCNHTLHVLHVMMAFCESQPLVAFATYYGTCIGGSLSTTLKQYRIQRIPKSWAKTISFFSLLFLKNFFEGHESFLWGH